MLNCLIIGGPRATAAALINKGNCPPVRPLVILCCSTRGWKIVPVPFKNIMEITVEVKSVSFIRFFVNGHEVCIN